MKTVVALGSLLLSLLIAYFLVRSGVPVETLLSLGGGLLVLAWLAGLLTLPWNVSFAARRVALAAGQGAHAAEAHAIARRMMWFAIGGHLISAGTVAAVTWYAGVPFGYHLAALFGLSITIRPAGEYYHHLRERVSTLGQEVRYPREDVIALLGRVERIGILDEQDRRQSAELVALRASVDDLDRRLRAMVRQFTDTVDGLSDNHQVIEGIKAFLRLAREA